MHSSLLEPVLVLNANFEPMNVCTIRRAMGLIFSDKASMLVNGRGEVHTSSTSFPAPSVIRLDRMIKRPRPQIKLNKQEVFRRDRHTCQYCGSADGELTLDHVVPRHLGGSHSWDNLVTACRTCNHKKGGRTVENAGMQPRNRPSAPSASAKYIFGRYLSNNQGWDTYIEGW
ncbi:MAG: HNH endonuclease [Chloroflexi bacterium]|nr:HNH endonuclease [Chloroflexota bacterium]